MRAIPLLLIAISVSGCLTVDRRVTFDDSYVRTESRDAGTRVDVTTVASFEPTDSYSGGSISIQLASVTKCLTGRKNFYSRRERTVRDYKPPEARLAVAGGFGLGAGGAIFGLVRLNQAPSLSNEQEVDPETGEKLPSEREVAFNQGVVAVSLAVPVLAWSLVEAGRAKDSTSYVGIIAKDETIEERDCGSVPLSGLLTMGAGARSLKLGQSDPAGLVKVELTGLARTDLLAAEPLFVDGVAAGELRIPTPLLEFLRRAGGVGSVGRKELAAFVADYPASFATAEARSRLDILVAAENAAFKVALRESTRVGLEAFLTGYPDADPALREQAATKLNEIAERWADEAVEVWDSQFLHDVSEYGEKSVRFYLHFENKTGRSVVGVLTQVTAKNSFGKVVLSNTFENEVRLPPHSKERNTTAWVFKDNPFIPGEVYDGLWKSVIDGTGSVDVRVLKVILEGGKVLTPKPGKGK